MDKLIGNGLVQTINLKFLKFLEPKKHYRDYPKYEQILLLFYYKYENIIIIIYIINTIIH